MISVRHILVTTDLSAVSSSAMEYAAWLSQKEKSVVSVLYCVENLPAAPVYTVDLTVDAFRNEVLAAEKKRLSAYVRKYSRSFRVQPEEVLIVGTAASAIVDYAQQNGVDLIVMNTHGRTGIRHMVLGSVAEKVVQTSSCPVLTISSRTKRKAAKKK